MGDSDRTPALRKIAKKCVITYRKYLSHWKPYRKILSDRTIECLHPSVRFINGLTKSSRLNLSRGCYIDRRTEIDASHGTIAVGAGTFIHSDACIYGNVQIGEYCLISKRFFASSGSHDFSAPSYIRLNDESSRDSQPIVVDDDVWIGCNVFIKAGIRVGKGAVIGANSVVTKNVYPYQVVAGAPAGIIKSRFDFKPVYHLCAECPEHLPYFYSGFHQRNSTQDPTGFELTGSHFVLAAPHDLASTAAVRLVGFTDAEVESQSIGTPRRECLAGPFDIVLPCQRTQLFSDPTSPRISTFAVHSATTTVRISEIEYLSDSAAD